MENPMCTADGMMAMSGGVMPPMDGAMRAHGGAGDAGHAHADHGDIACDYCVIVASLLPVALVLLGLLPWRRPVCPPLPARRAPACRRMAGLLRTGAAAGGLIRASAIPNPIPRMSVAAAAASRARVSRSSHASPYSRAGGGAIACAWPSLCACAHAAEQAPPRTDEARKGEARTLDTLVVTAVAPGAPLTWTTDPKLPRQPVPASDGADYLKTIPGFAAIRNGGTNGDPVLRGMFGSRLNVVDNGGTLAGACPARMDNPLSYISPQTYDRLVIVRGPQTVRWGQGLPPARCASSATRHSMLRRWNWMPVRWPVRAIATTRA
jgi:hypothetical protein